MFTDTRAHVLHMHADIPCVRTQAAHTSAHTAHSHAHAHAKAQLSETSRAQGPQSQQRLLGPGSPSCGHRETRSVNFSRSPAPDPQPAPFPPCLPAPEGPSPAWGCLWRMSGASSALWSLRGHSQARGAPGTCPGPGGLGMHYLCRAPHGLGTELFPARALPSPSDTFPTLSQGNRGWG